MTRFDYRARSIVDVDGIRYMNGYEIYDLTWEGQPIAWGRTLDVVQRIVYALQLSQAVADVIDHNTQERTHRKGANP